MFATVTDEQRKEVFQDTVEWIKSYTLLTNSVTGSRKHTEVFYDNDYPGFDVTNLQDMMVTVSKEKTFQAAMRLYKENHHNRIAVLNFADARKPGGGVVNGRKAQEECLCRTSTLYPVLFDNNICKPFYAYHKKQKHGKASDAIIYSPQIIILKTDEELPERMDPDDWAFVDVITMAAPDLRAQSNPFVKKFPVMTEAELFGYHVKRAMHMLTVAASKKVDILVLGALGCGVFKNDPKVVAAAYKTALEMFPNVFKKVVFAVYCTPAGSDNYDAFIDVFKNGEAAIDPMECFCGDGRGMRMD